MSGAATGPTLTGALLEMRSSLKARPPIGNLSLISPCQNAYRSMRPWESACRLSILALGSDSQGRMDQFFSVRAKAEVSVNGFHFLNGPPDRHVAGSGSAAANSSLTWLRHTGPWSMRSWEAVRRSRTLALGSDSQDRMDQSGSLPATGEDLVNAGSAMVDFRDA